MFLESESTVRRVLRTLAEAGGTIKSLQFAKITWPNDDGWKNRPTRKRPTSPEARMSRRAGTLLGAIAKNKGYVSNTGPQTWTLRPEGWAYLSQSFTPPIVQIAESKPLTSTVDYAPKATVVGSPYTPYSVIADPRYPGYYAVTWTPGTQPQWVPAHAVQWNRVPDARTD